jgi:hypothetical protein
VFFKKRFKALTECHDAIDQSALPLSTDCEMEAATEVVFIVLGQQVRFAASEWRTFAFFESGQPTPAQPTQVALQGERPLLHSITAARADQRITIMAERRPGSADVFVLAVDLCPEH